MSELRNLRMFWALYPLLGLTALFMMIGPAWAQEEPVPFECTGEAFTVRNTHAELYLIDQTVMPFVFTRVPEEHSCLWGPFGPGGELIPIQVNNIGYNIVDNFLYGIAMPLPVNPPSNYGIVKIDKKATVIPVASTGLPDDRRFLAGDVSTDGSKFYINTDPPSVLYTVTLNQPEPLVVTAHALPGPRVDVADWAVNPTDGKLYGAEGRGDPSEDSKIYQLDPDPSSPTFGINELATCACLPMALSGPEQWYGGAWFDANGYLWVYRNNDWIYKVELDLTAATAKVVENFEGAAGPSSFNDAAACALGRGQIEKFYTYTWNDWDLRCALSEPDSETGELVCLEYRLPNIVLDDDIFADPLDQIGDDFVLYGKVIGKKTVVTPGQYIAVSNIDVTVEGDVWILEDFEDCTDIGSVNPNSVPGGVQVVLIDANGDVWDIDDDLAAGIGGSIVLGTTNALVHVEDVPSGSTVRVMVKFKPHDTIAIGDSCENYEILYDADPLGNGIEIGRASAILTVVERD